MTAPGNMAEPFSPNGQQTVRPSDIADLGDEHGAIPSEADRADIDRPYRAFATAEWFVIIARGGLAFRFGPYDEPAVGKIISQCQDEKINCLVTGNCGAEFDWDLARDLCQTPHQIRAGDHVLHKPSGETWVVAYVDGDFLAACGWPFSEVARSECVLRKACSDTEHATLLLELSKVGDKRGSMARSVLEAIEGGAAC